MSDKRQYQRVKLNIPGILSHGHTNIGVMIEDVSIQGVRVSAEEEALATLPFDSHQPYRIAFLTDDKAPLIEAWVEQLYRHTDRRKTAVAVGCKVDHIDVESLAALRQLILLNSGDPSMSQYDIDTLTNAIYGKASNASQS